MPHFSYSTLMLKRLLLSEHLTLCVFPSLFLTARPKKKFFMQIFISQAQESRAAATAAWENCTHYKWDLVATGNASLWTFSLSLARSSDSQIILNGGNCDNSDWNSPISRNERRNIAKQSCLINKHKWAAKCLYLVRRRKFIT